MGNKGLETQNGDSHNFYTPFNISRAIKSRMLSWRGHAAHMGIIKNVYKMLVGKFQ
jgi:hypothetical protein